MLHRQSRISLEMKILFGDKRLPNATDSHKTKLIRVTAFFCKYNIWQYLQWLYSQAQARHYFGLMSIFPSTKKRHPSMGQHLREWVVMGKLPNYGDDIQMATVRAWELPNEWRINMNEWYRWWVSVSVLPSPLLVLHGWGLEDQRHASGSVRIFEWISSSKKAKKTLEFGNRWPTDGAVTRAVEQKT